MYVLIVAPAWPTESMYATNMATFSKELSNSVPTLAFKATTNPGQNSGGVTHIVLLISLGSWYMEVS